MLLKCKLLHRLGEYQRCVGFIDRNGLEKHDIHFIYLKAACYFEIREYDKALKGLEDCLKPLDEPGGTGEENATISGSNIIDDMKNSGLSPSKPTTNGFNSSDAFSIYGGESDAGEGEGGSEGRRQHETSNVGFSLTSSSCVTTRAQARNAQPGNKTYNNSKMSSASALSARNGVRAGKSLSKPANTLNLSGGGGRAKSRFTTSKRSTFDMPPPAAAAAAPPPDLIALDSTASSNALNTSMARFNALCMEAAAAVPSAAAANRASKFYAERRSVHSAAYLLRGRIFHVQQNRLFAMRSLAMAVLIDPTSYAALEYLLNDAGISEQEALKLLSDIEKQQQQQPNKWQFDPLAFELLVEIYRSAATGQKVELDSEHVLSQYKKPPAPPVTTAANNSMDVSPVIKTSFVPSGVGGSRTHNNMSASATESATTTKNETANNSQTSTTADTQHSQQQDDEQENVFPNAESSFENDDSSHYSLLLTSNRYDHVNNQSSLLSSSQQQRRQQQQQQQQQQQRFSPYQKSLRQSQRAKQQQQITARQTATTTKNYSQRTRVVDIVTPMSRSSRPSATTAPPITTPLAPPPLSTENFTIALDAVDSTPLAVHAVGNDTTIWREAIVNDCTTLCRQLNRHSVELRAASARRQFRMRAYVAAAEQSGELLRDEPFYMQIIPTRLGALVQQATAAGMSNSSSNSNNNNAAAAKPDFTNECSDARAAADIFQLANALVSVAPREAVSWYAVACYYYTTNKLDLTRRFLLKASSLNSSMGELWLMLGHCFAIEAEHDQACTAYFHAAQVMPSSHVPLLYIAKEYIRTESFLLAGKFIDDALVMHAQDPELLLEAAMLRIKRHQHQNVPEKTVSTKGGRGGAAAKREVHFVEALNFLRLAQRYIVTNFEVLPRALYESVLYNMGYCSLKLDDFDEAVKYLEEARTMNSTNSETLKCLAFCHARQRDKVKAMNFATQCMSIETHVRAARADNAGPFVSGNGTNGSVGCLQMSVMMRELMSLSPFHQPTMSLGRDMDFDADPQNQQQQQQQAAPSKGATTNLPPAQPQQQPTTTTATKKTIKKGTRESARLKTFRRGGRGAGGNESNSDSSPV